MNQPSITPFHRPNLRLSRVSAAIAVGLALAYAPLHAATPAARQAHPAQQAASPASGGQKSASAKRTKSKKQGSQKQATNISAVTVTGVRASLESALSIKRNASQIVDSIVAEDIGKLPDDNVAEALQRISGIQISRNYGEGSSIAIRGLTEVRTEVNGGDVFTANGGRQLSLEDIPSELLAGIDVYKNPAADIPPGGIGGTVNLRTHKPFDFKGQKISLSAEYDYWQMAKKGEPSGSFLYSNRWNTSVGEFGALVDVAYQKHDFRWDDITNQPFYAVQASPDSPETNYPGYYGKTLYVPHGGGVDETLGHRRRLGIDVALQWRPNNDTELYFRGLRSAYKFHWNDYSTFTYTGTTGIIPDPNAKFSFAPDGSFISGTFYGTSDGNGGYTPGIGTDSNSSLTDRYSVTTDLSLGGSWNATNDLTLDSDLRYIRANTHERRYILGMHTTSPYLYQNIGTSLPIINVDQAAITDPANNLYNYALDNIDKSSGRELAWNANANYTFASDILHSMKVGVRTTNRSAVTYNTNYSDFIYLGQPLSNFPDSSWVYKSYSDLFRGNADTYGNVIVPNPELLNQYPQSKEVFGASGQPLQYGPQDVNHQGQNTYGVYGMLFFGFDDGAVPVDGNIGVRVVRTNVTSNGVMTNPTGQGYLPVNVDSSYTETLPSLNVIAHLTDDLQWRFAASKAMSRPSFTDMSPNLSLSRPNANGINSFTGSAGNPNLGPMTARQFDTSLEWYFSRSGLLYGDLFYKKVNGFIAHGVFNETYNGHVYQIARPVNGNNGTIKGFETGYQQFFDFLPAPFDGLGTRVNYTYVYSKAPSPEATSTSGEALKVPLEGLSKNSYNLIAMYEKGPVQARIAYNWRSRWLVTTQGNGTGNLPRYNKAYGQVDASVTYHFTKDFDMTLEGTDLTDTYTRTLFGPRPGDVQTTGRVFAVRAHLNF